MWISVVRFSVGILTLPLLFAGCANHPDISDRTRYSTYEIIQKVRCEAAEQIWQHVEDKKTAGTWRSLRDTTKRRRELSRTIAGIEANKLSEIEAGAHLGKDLARVARKLLWLQQQKTALEVAQMELDKTDSENKQDLKTLIANDTNLDKALTQARKAEESQKRVRENYERQSQAAAELVLSSQLLKSLQAELKRHNRSSLSDFRNAKQLLDRIDSELSAVVQSGGSFFQTSIAMQFRFDLTEQNKASAEGKVTFPIHFGSSAIGFDGALDKKRQSDRAIGIAATFGDLYDLYASQQCHDAGLTDPEHRRAKAYPITGNVGMRELVDQYIRISKDTTLAKSTFGDGKLFTDKIVFTTEISGGFDPSIDLSPTPKHKISFGIDLSASRKDIHEVIVDISPAKAAPAVADATLNIGSVPEVGIRIVGDEYELGPGPSLPSR